MSGKVYLVGAGCGSADLITLRGMTLLQEAEAVIYDALIDPALLDAAPASAEKISVGKRAGAHSETQERIHEILIEQAQKHRIVIRLKGGDPFVFGRGGEEALALEAAGIAYEIVPGISSCIAVPELAGIPVTHRETARSFHVITAHDAFGWREAETYAKTEGTLVFLMGLGYLRQMMRDLVNAFMPIDTPAAVISKGGTPEQRVVRGCILNIADLAEEAELEAPAVIVVGRTARFSLLSPQKRPLDGVRVTVTGTPHFYKKLTQCLTPAGASVRQICRMQIVPQPWTLEPLLGQAHWLVLTSANSAEMLLQKLREERIDIRRLPPEIAVIGEGTGAVLEEHGLYPSLMPETANAAALGEALAAAVHPGERVLILRAAKGRAALTDALTAAGIPFEDVKTYDTRAEAPSGAVDTDHLIFASASGVRAFFEGGGTVGAHTRLLCIGEVTAAALREYSAEPYRIARRPSAEGILQIILEEHHV